MSFTESYRDLGRRFTNWYTGKSEREKHKSSAAEREAGAAAYDKRDKRRRSAIKAADEGAAQAARNVAEGREQAARNQQAIRQGASQATAMGIPTGTAMGGGTIAAIGQTGMDAEAEGIRQRGEDEKMVRDLMQQASERRMQADEYAAAQGNEQEDYAAAIAQGTSDAEQAIQDAQGFWDDDEEGAMRTIRSVVARLRVQNPRAADELEKKYLTRGGEGYDRLHSWWD